MPSAAPFAREGHGENGEAADEPSGDHGPEAPGIAAEEVFFDRLFEEQAEDGGGDERGDKIEEQAQALRVTTGEAGSTAGGGR